MCCGNSILQKGLPFFYLHKIFYTLEKNEKYIAPLYNFMIKKGLKVTISIVDAKKVHVLGTPEELNVFLNQE